MLEMIKTLLFDPAGADMTTNAHSDGSLATALLIQAALADGQFSNEERAVVTKILTRDHGASEAEAEDLIDAAEAEVRASAQMFGFTSAVNHSLEYDAKVALIEQLWEVVLADGVIDSHEGSLMRRLAGLLQVTDHDSAHARQRVQARKITESDNA